MLKKSTSIFCANVTHGEMKEHLFVIISHNFNLSNSILG